MKHVVSMPHAQGLFDNPFLIRINPIPRIKTYFFKIHSIIFLASTPRYFSKGLFRVRLPVKILKAMLPSSSLVTWLAHLNPLYLITLTILGDQHKLWSSSLWNLLHSPFSSFLLPNIRLRILFSNTLSLHSSFNVRDHVSQPYTSLYLVQNNLVSPKVFQHGINH